MSRTPYLPLFFFCISIFLPACHNFTTHFSEEVIDRLPEEVDYNFHIRPILADRCFACHGFDEEAREADLRLDIAESAYAKTESGAYAIKPGKVNHSEVFQRIISEDQEMLMPPPESKLSLSPYEKALIAKWIDQGATYKKHWAFSPLQSPKISKELSNASPSEHIDLFVKNRLDKEGLTPAPLADKERLIRRLSFDLTGLLPR